LTSPYSKPPPPIPADLPAGRFGRWLYEFWDYVARNRLQAADNLVPGTGIIIGTSTATFTIAHRTSGVAAGTYGSAGAIPQIVVNNLGHITSVGTASAGGGGATALAGVVLGTTTTGTLTAAFAPNPSFSGTATSTGFYAFGRVAAAVGSSSLVEAVPSAVFGSAGIVSSTAQTYTLMAGTIPANGLLRSGRGFTFHAMGTVGTAVTRIGLAFGTGTLAAFNSGVAQRWSIYGEVVANDANSQKYVTYSWYAGGPTSELGTLALSAASGQVLAVQGTKAASTAAVAQEFFTVRFMN